MPGDRGPEPRGIGPELIASAISPRLYGAMESLWAILVLISMAAGILQNQRAGLHRSV